MNSIGRSPGYTENDRLVDYPALVRWCREAGVLGVDEAARLTAAGEADPAGARGVVQRAVALREALFEVWHADIHGEPIPDGPLGIVNAEVAAALPHARLEPRTGEADGFAWTWEEDRAALDRPLWPLARAAAELLASPERERVRECGASTCLWLFLDRSRNRRRRWCDMKSCGNREKVRQHRERRRRAD